MGKVWALDTFEKLHAAGYTYDGPTPCAAPKCGKVIFWFVTPNNHCMPFERMEDGRYQPHFASCSEARKFSRKADGTVVSR